MNDLDKARLYGLNKDLDAVAAFLMGLWLQDKDAKIMDLLMKVRVAQQEIELLQRVK